MSSTKEIAPRREAFALEAYFDRLWPLHRSITGAGLRATLDILAEIMPHARLEVPSGTEVLDWTVPKEWVVRQAYLIRPDGRRFCDVGDNNLHLVNYSIPFRGRLRLDALQAHLHSLPELPEAIPYITSYYAPRWGFCLSHEEREALPEGDYEVVVDTGLVEGALSIAEAVLPGEVEEEVLLSSYTYHPSLANNELSGPLVLSFLYRRLAAWHKRRLTYRFLLLPETIGSIAYLALHGRRLIRSLVAGYVVTCVGTAEPFVYKRSRQGGSQADRAAEAVLAERAGERHRIADIRPDRGGDERQYNAPGFDLPVGCLMRSPSSSYAEYHTSLDNKDLISFEAMEETLDAYEAICRALDGNRRYLNLAPFGEPQRGRRGLYGTLGDRRRPLERSALMWLLSDSDGDHDLLDIAARSGLGPELLISAAERLLDAGLLRSLATDESARLPEPPDALEGRRDAAA